MFTLNALKRNYLFLVLFLSNIALLIFVSQAKLAVVWLKKLLFIFE